MSWNAQSAFSGTGVGCDALNDGINTLAELDSAVASCPNVDYALVNKGSLIVC